MHEYSTYSAAMAWQLPLQLSAFCNSCRAIRSTPVTRGFGLRSLAASVNPAEPHRCGRKLALTLRGVRVVILYQWCYCMDPTVSLPLPTGGGEFLITKHDHTDS